ncbi:hypothetical protein [Granulicoccus phenolivorans]|uniref:hypothetical protein n=1 Tax=Granulicoccus phenolivorans TaxID=266854 RepID=UPI00047AFC5F|nr:hypothetical protein [Granulicoccus phenolivorans]
MRRSVLDKLISYVGLILAAVMLVAGGLLTWASVFVAGEVQTQFAAQDITMPSQSDIDKLENPADKAALQPYVGQKLTTGPQARAYADNYILAHMNASSGGRTYQQVSGEYMAMPDKTTPEAQQAAALRNTLFQGNTLRGLLLYGYAFATIGTIAGIAAAVAFVAGIVLAILGFLGLRHARAAGAETVE